MPAATAAALPPDEVSSEQIEDTMAMLSEAGVNVVEAEEPEDTASATAAEPALSVASPMVGTFYRAPAPDADPYVEVGQVVEVGQTVCIIEAMKLMNEIESEVRGKVVRVLVENAQPVQFEQRLMLIDVSGS